MFFHRNIVCNKGIKMTHLNKVTSSHSYSSKALVTTKTAIELKKIKDIISKSDGISLITFLLLEESIIDFKNELKEILDDKNKDEDYVKYHERVYVELMNLIEEIEQVENNEMCFDCRDSRDK